MEQENTIITLIDESGNEVEFDLLLTFDYEGKRYAAMLPLDEVENVAEGGVVILEIIKDGDGENYATLTNEILLNEVFEEFLARFDELDEDDD
ncbi:MAG: DUF1292 domain-containing protein [Clostridiales bacterium]|nr:DUF1292 domain-containing protein [Clostridiales bacterium]